MSSEEPYSEEELKKAVEEVMRNDEEFRREINEGIRRQEEGFLTRLVKGASKAIFGSVFADIVRRVVQVFLGGPPY